ncbi:MAG: hypothetical protein R6V85_09620 [Polyangia bacterium]
MSIPRRELLLAPLLLLLALGCGAARGPIGVAAQAGSDLSAGERAYILDGDFDPAAEHLAAAVERGSPSALFLLGEILDALGRPSDALDSYEGAILAAHRGASHPDEALAAAMATVAIRNRVPGLRPRIENLLDELERRPGKLPPAAWYQLKNLSYALARRADPDENPRVGLDDTGSLSRWRIAGPAGPLVWETYDELVEDLQRWTAVVDLGPGRGRRATETVDSDGHTVEAALGELALPGVSRARTTVVLDSSATVHFRLETGGAALLLAAGIPIGERDPRLERPPSVQWFAAELPAGSTRIELLLADSQQAPWFSLVALTGDGQPAAVEHSPAIAASAASVVPIEARPARASRPATSLARLRAALWRDDFASARDLLDDLGCDESSPVALVAVSEMARADSSIPGEIGLDRARRAMSRALEAEPRLWRARLFLARLVASDGRVEDSFRMVERGLELDPDEPEIPTRLASLAAALGWEPELADAVGRIDAQLPGECPALVWKLSLARRRQRFERARELAGDIAACEAGSPALAEELLRAGLYEEAIEERRRLSRRSPDDGLAALDLAGAAVAAGDLELAQKAARRSRELDPASPEPLLLRSDALAAAGDEERALDLLVEARSARQGPHPILDRRIAALSGELLYSELRVDGAAVIESFLESGVEYETSAVWVLDRAVHLLERDGSRTEIVHSIARVQSDEALEEHGELELPESSVLLTARTVKPGGRFVEPERIANKSSLSMPELEPGDFVEVEYAAFHPPSQVFPGGFDTARFYFADFDTAFHRSEMILVAPAEVEVLLDPRGDCPDPERRTAGGLRISSWRVRGRLPRNREPSAPDPAEHLPSIRAAADASWEALAARIRDMCAELDRPSESIRSALDEALHGLPRTTSVEKKARAIYGWVMENIEDEGGLFEEAAHVIARRFGDRTRAAIALLRAAGLDARLAFGVSAGQDETPGSLPDFDVIDHPLLLVEGERWVHLGRDGAPYGYLPPCLRNRPALLVADAGWKKTDGGTTPRDEQLIDLELEVGHDGSVAGHVSERLSGTPAADWRSQLRRLADDELETRFQESYLSSAVPSASLESLEIEGLDDPESPLVLRYSFSAERLARSSGEDLELEIPFGMEISRGIGGLPVRASPLVLCSHMRRELRARVLLPPGAVTDLPEDESAEGRWGRIARRASREQDAISLEVETLLDVERVSPRDYPTFLDFAGRVDEISDVRPTISLLEPPTI